MSALDFVRSELRTLAGYSSARMEAGSTGTLLNANESPWPQDSRIPLHRYPDPQPAELKARLAQLYGVDPAQLLVGRGSDEAIDLLVRACCRAGQDSVAIQSPTFGMYAVAAAVQDAGIVDAPLGLDERDPFNVDRVLASLLPKTRLVFVCSPNNPTGAIVPRSEVLRLAAAVAGRALVVVDEAYVEFADTPSLVADVAQTPNLAVLRTLSKAHALAGARIGSLIAAPELIAVLRRIMAPYPLPTPSVDAALAALEPAALAESRIRVDLVCRERQRIIAALVATSCVLEVLPSQANFLCLRFADVDATSRCLAAAGLVVRDLRRYPGLQDALRISVGVPADNDRVIEALAQLSHRTAMGQRREVAA